MEIEELMGKVGIKNELHELVMEQKETNRNLEKIIIQNDKILMDIWVKKIDDMMDSLKESMG